MSPGSYVLMANHRPNIHSSAGAGYSANEVVIRTLGPRLSQLLSM